MHIRIVLAHVHLCTKFGVPRFKGVRARGKKAEKNKIAPWGHKFDPSFSHWHTIQTKALLTWKFGLPATSRLGCNPDTTFFEGFTRRHVERARWHAAPRDRRHRRSAVPAHRMSRLSSGSAQPFRRYSLGICRSLIRDVTRDIRWQLALRAW